MDRPSLPRLPRARAASLLLALVLAGCAATPPSVVPSGAVATDASPAGSGPVTGSPAAAPPASAALPEPVAGPLAGTWRVRKVLAPEDRSALLADATFDEEAWVLRPGCDVEPCATLEVSITPLARSRPVATATLERAGDRYRSPGTTGNEAPCLAGTGDRIPGGASTTRTVALWLAESRPAGSSVTTVVLQGALELRLTPTAIGRAGGCVETTARYDLTGRRGAVAVIDEQPTRPPAADPGDLVPLPDIEVAVDGARIEYFDVEGSTSGELLESIAFGGVRACGEIDYEWHEGDARPAACAVSRFPGFEDGIREGRDDDGDCVIVEADIDGRSTIHVPRWVAPERVPEALVAWWRDVVEFIRVHEAVHVEISRDAVGRLERALDGADCDDAGTIIGEWAGDLQAAQAAFDRTEYAKPWPEPPPGI